MVYLSTEIVSSTITTITTTTTVAADIDTKSLPNIGYSVLRNAYTAFNNSKDFQLHKQQEFHGEFICKRNIKRKINSFVNIISIL